MDISSDKMVKLSSKKTWTWLRKGNLMRENEVRLMAAQNKSININYVKAKIDNT